MTDKQRRFIEEYCVDNNATKAAIRAGYSENSAYSMGHENLNKPEIAEAIDAERLKRSERTQITADAVLQNLWDLALDARADKAYGPAATAYSLVGKHLGMFSDRLIVQDMREAAVKAADEHGLDPDEVLAEVERQMAAKR